MPQLNQIVNFLTESQNLGKQILSNIIETINFYKKRVKVEKSIESTVKLLQKSARDLLLKIIRKWSMMLFIGSHQKLKTIETSRLVYINDIRFLLSRWQKSKKITQNVISNSNVCI